MKNDALVNEIYEMVKPIADELNYDIYHVKKFIPEMQEVLARVMEVAFK